MAASAVFCSEPACHTKAFLPQGSKRQASVPNHHRLELGVVLDDRTAKLPTNPRRTVAAKRYCGVEQDVVTDAGAEGHVLTVRQQRMWALIDADPSLATGAACVALTADAEGVDALFEALSREINGEQPGRAAALESLTRLIMIRLLRLCAHSLPARPTRQSELP